MIKTCIFKLTHFCRDEDYNVSDNVSDSITEIMFIPDIFLWIYMFYKSKNQISSLSFISLGTEFPIRRFYPYPNIS